MRKALNRTIITKGGRFGGWVNFSADETTEVGYDSGTPMSPDVP